MLIENLNTLFKRDLNRLKEEMLAYKNEKIIWQVEGTVNNSAGNLCLHLIGNLNTFIGAAIGKTGYVRQRELEFSLKDVPVARMVEQIEETILILEAAFQQLQPEDLAKEYPIMVLKEKISTELFLLHLSTHLNYHLGQISYHRRLLDRELA